MNQDAGSHATIAEALETDLGRADTAGRPVAPSDAALLRLLATQIQAQAARGELNAALVREYRQAKSAADLDNRGANDSDSDVDPLARFTVLPGGTEMGDPATA